jgi:DNA-binding Lrp family transcriptional regulator
MSEVDEPAESANPENDDGPATGPFLDQANRAIIEALQRDGRQPYGAIAQAVGLSEAAVRRRVQRLREAGVMQIVAVTDPLQLGFTRQAMIGLSVEGDVRVVADKLSALPEVAPSPSGSDHLRSHDASAVTFGAPSLHLRSLFARYGDVSHCHRAGEDTGIR